ncbi:U-box domain-containing protein 5 [Bienertia sinuspersici]
MGSDVLEVQETPSHAIGIRVHLSMCTQLLGLVNRISSIVTDIEAARPRCSLGIQSLCQLHNAIERARELVQNCRTSSKLYLAITGDEIKRRFEGTKDLLDQSLSELQSMVPVALKLQISEILADLRAAMLYMDPCDELAGKALRAMLQQDVSPVDSVGNSEVELLQFSASMLHLTSQKELLIERRYIKRLLNDVKEGNSTKRNTLKYLLHLLRKYEKLIVQGQTRNFSTQHAEAYISVKSDSKSPSFSSHTGHASFLHTPDIPEEFKCPLSSKLMNDPVIISSGQTYERAYIQKWFDDGQDTCPRTGMKLPDMSLTSNTIMSDLISKWSMEQGIGMSNPRKVTAEYGSLENSSNSFRSNASSMKDIELRIDTSNLSFGSLDSSYSNISHVKRGDSTDSNKDSSVVGSPRFQFYHSIDDIKTQFLSNVRGLPWESQCTAIQDVNAYLIYYNPSCAFISSENFLDPLIWFLQDALDKRDVKAQKAGSQLYLTFLRSSRKEPEYLSEDVYTLLASFLSTEAAAETLAIMEVLSTQVSFSNFAASSALTSIFQILDTDQRDFQEPALRILYNFSSSINTSSSKLASDWVPILVPFLGDTSLAGICLAILQNLCKFEDTKCSIVETEGCIASIIKLLEDCSCKDQERAVDILLTLCSQHEYYCHLVLREGCIPALVDVSINGSDKGKGIALELLRQLKEIRYEEDEQECPRPNVDVSEGHQPNHHMANDSNQKSSRPSGFIRRLFKRK